MKSHLFTLFRKTWLLFLILFLGTLSSCMRELDLDSHFEENRVVLKGVLIADNPIIEITLSYLSKLNDTIQHPINNAEVKIYCNNNLLGVMQNLDDGEYVLDEIPKSGKSYCVETIIDGKLITAETTVPEVPDVVSIEMDSLDYLNHDYELLHTVVLKDDANVKNNYWMWSLKPDRADSVDYYQIIRSDCFYFDDFMKTGSLGSSHKFADDYSVLVRMPDKAFSGEQISINYTCSGNEVYWSCFDEHYDQFMKDYLTFIDNVRTLDDLPLFYSPAFIHSNVENGTGILGSYALTKINVDQIDVESVNQF